MTSPPYWPARRARAGSGSRDERSSSREAAQRFAAERAQGRRRRGDGAAGTGGQQDGRQQDRDGTHGKTDRKRRKSVGPAWREPSRRGARALASAAPLLLIDEPAEHLDPISADSLIADLATIARTQGRAILIVTHRRQGLAVADKVVVLDRVGDRATVVAQGRHLDLLATNEAYRTVTDQEGA